MLSPCFPKMTFPENGRDLGVRISKMQQREPTLSDVDNFVKGCISWCISERVSSAKLKVDVQMKGGLEGGGDKLSCICCTCHYTARKATIMHSDFDKIERPRYAGNYDRVNRWISSVPGMGSTNHMSIRR
jgi:hypothetical protein